MKIQKGNFQYIIGLFFFNCKSILVDASWSPSKTTYARFICKCNKKRWCYGKWVKDVFFLARQLDVRHVSVWQNERKLNESRWNLSVSKCNWFAIPLVLNGIKTDSFKLKYGSKEKDSYCIARYISPSSSSISISTMSRILIVSNTALQ